MEENSNTRENLLLLLKMTVFSSFFIPAPFSARECTLCRGMVESRGLNERQVPLFLFFFSFPALFDICWYFFFFFPYSNLFLEWEKKFLLASTCKQITVMHALHIQIQIQQHLLPTVLYSLRRIENGLGGKKEEKKRLFVIELHKFDATIYKSKLSCNRGGSVDPVGNAGIWCTYRSRVRAPSPAAISSRYFLLKRVGESGI